MILDVKTDRTKIIPKNLWRKFDEIITKVASNKAVSSLK